MAWIYTTRPTGSFTLVSRPTSSRQGRYGIGVFGTARFGISDGWIRVVRPTKNTSAVPGIAIPGFAIPGTISQGWILIKRPQ